MQETLHFWTTGEWVTPFARQLFYEEHKEWSYIEKLLLYCMAGTDTPEEILKQYGIDLLAGRRCLIGNTKHGTYALVEDKEHPELEKAKGLGGYPIIKEEMTDLSLRQNTRRTLQWNALPPSSVLPDPGPRHSNTGKAVPFCGHGAIGSWRLHRPALPAAHPLCRHAAERLSKHYPWL